MQIMNNPEGQANQTPWNELFRLAKAGDKDALHKLHLAAQPLIKPFFNVPKFYNRLGREEIRSTASFALVNYFSRHTGLPPDGEVPFLLRHVIYCGLVSALRKAKRRKSFEQPAGAAGGADPFTDFTAETDDGAGSGEASAEREDEPEALCLKHELRETVREAVRQLKKNERFVIMGLYYRHQSTTALARELHCTPQNVRYMRKNAMLHLQQLLKKCELA